MPQNKRRKPIGVYVLIAGVAFLLTVLLSNIPTIRSVELDFRDFLFELRGPLEIEDSPIVLVAISEEADYEIPEKYPWPTNVYAKLIENLNKAGARVIVFDVIFDQPDQYDLKNDSLFAQAITDNKNVVLAGEILDEEVANSRQIELLFPQNILLDSGYASVGMVDVQSDEDGAIRSYSFGKNHDGKSYYKLGLEALAKFKDIPRDSIDELTASEDAYFKLGNYLIKKDAANSFIINYYGEEGYFPIYDLSNIIDDPEYTTRMESEAGFDMNTFDDPDFGEGLLYDGVFKDKIVIVGATMQVLKDFYKTPLPKIEVSASGSKRELPRPGYEIHAHAIQTIIDGNYLSRQSAWSVLLFMGIGAVLLALLNWLYGAKWGVAIMLVLMGGYVFISIHMFLGMSLFLNVTSILLVLFLTETGAVGYQYFVEEKEKKRIQGMFSSYVSPKLVQQMVESGKEPQLGGEDTYMTAFFSDIESFSTFSEQLEPKQLVQLINDYLTSMTNILTDQGGTLDKYIGDAIVAFFGAPVPMEDHALRACISSQLMQKELVLLREKWARDGWPEIVTQMKNRMGMNTGEMVTGNMGSNRRFNYTMMGDNVNLAARCESGAKAFGVYTMVTESTKVEAEKHGDDCVFRYLDNIVVKGRTQPVKMYEIADLRSDADQELMDCIGLFEQGLEKYFNQEWDQAIQTFEKSSILERHPNNPSLIFLNRCKQLKLDPPAPDWDGVYVMKSK